MHLGLFRRKNSFVQLLDSLIVFPPEKTQIAVDGNWEHSLKIPFSEGKPQANVFQEFLNGRRDNIAIEVFSKNTYNEDFFFGVRYHPKLEKCLYPLNFVSGVVDLVFSSESILFSEFIGKLSRLLTGKKRGLLATEPDSISLGVVDYWKTYGSVCIWKNGEDFPKSESDLYNKVRENKSLLKNGDNYVGIEFVYKVLPVHWIAFQVSDYNGREWELSLKKVMLYLDFLRNL